MEKCTFSGNCGFGAKRCDFAKKLILDGKVDLDYPFKAEILMFLTNVEAARPEGAKTTGIHEIPPISMKLH